MRGLEVQATEVIREVLRSVLGEVRSLQVATGEVDLLLKAEGRRFAVEVKGRSSTPAMLDAWQRLKATRRTLSATPLLVVPVVSERQRAELAQHDVNWLDFAGNGHISDRDLLIHIEGRVPLVRRGRPSSVFERRSSRVVRTLLLQPKRSWSLVDAAASAKLDPGLTSRLLRRLEADGFLERGKDRTYRLMDPMRLAEAWCDAADFQAHTIHPAHVLRRTGSEVTEAVAKVLGASGVRYAATGLCAAWAYDQFAMYRLSTFYVEHFSAELVRDIEAIELGVSPSSANVWLVEPNDDGVFEGMRVVAGLPCVHPLQVWLDLKGHAERAKEAAEHMQTEKLLGFRP